MFEGRGDDRRIAGVLRKVKWPDKLRNLELLSRHVGTESAALDLELKRLDVAKNWTRSWLDKGAERGTWVESPRMPAFDQQHPEAFTKIQQALDKSAQPTLFT